MRRYVLFLAALMFFAGCDSLSIFPWTSQPDDGSDNPPAVGQGDSSLKRFDSEDEFRNYFAGQVNSQNNRYGNKRGSLDWQAGEGEPTAGDAPPSNMDGSGGEANGDDAIISVPAVPSPEDGDHSSTTTQETGVDEADVVKTDGTYLYVIDGERLHIVKALPLEEMAELSTVALEGSGLDLYLHGDLVVAMTATWGGPIYRDSWGDDVVGGETVGSEPSEGGAISEDVVNNGTDPQGEQNGDKGDDDNMADPDDGANPNNDGQSVDGNEPIDEPKPEPEPVPMPDPDDDADAIMPEPGAKPEPDLIVLPYEYTRPKTIVTVIDVSDRKAPRIVSTTKFEGTHSASRMINGVLRLVISNYPEYYYDVIPMLGTLELDATAIDAAVVVPKVEQIGTDGTVAEDDLVTWENLYRPTVPDGFGIVSVISMDVNDPAGFSSIGVVAEPGLIYSSLEALYLTNTNYSWRGDEVEDRNTTDIYKFRYVEGGVEPAAVGSVAGHILNQYSMGEYDGHLRVATTTPSFFFDGDSDEPVSAVYVLREVDEQLVVVGEIENIAPGETIQSARFMGDRGFVVTFEQIDPLFTLDLSEPTNPRIAGEIKVPGFSTFIVPMDEDHLLTVGQYIPEGDDGWEPRGVQLSIFDISDFANPVRTYNEVISGEQGAHSEALYDPKAFTYHAEAGLIALPISIWDYPDYDIPETDEFLEEFFEFIDDALEDVDLSDVDWGNLDEGELPDELAGYTEEEFAEIVEDMLVDFVMQLMPSGAIDGDVLEAISDLEDGGPARFDEVEGNGFDIGDFFETITETIEDQSFDGVAIYEVSPEGGFEQLGRISTRLSDESWYWSSFVRGVFSGQNVYAITSTGVRGASLDELEATHDVLFEQKDGDRPLLEPWVDTASGELAPDGQLIDD